MRHSHLPLAAGKTEADSGQRDGTDLGALQRCGMRRNQLLYFLPPAAYSGGAAPCAARKTGFPNLEEAVAKAQSVIKRVMAQEVERKYIGNVLPGKIRHKWKSIKSFFVPGRCATMFRTVFAVTGKKYK